MTPGAVLEYCQKYGEYLNIKIENMMLQHNESVVENNFVMPEHKDIAVVATAAGDGIKQMYIELGADIIVDGQQTMNPSSEDFIEAFDKLNADNIIVLPNNSNIVMAAKQAAELYDKANVVVLTTKSIAEGYAALSMMDLSVGDVDEICGNMQDAADNVTTGLITYAVRDSSMDGVEIKEGDYIGICDKHIVCDSSDKVDAVKKLFKSQDLKYKEVVLSIFGADVTEEERAAVSQFFAEEYPSIEFFEYEGKQDIYSFIFSIE